MGNTVFGLVTILAVVFSLQLVGENQDLKNEVDKLKLTVETMERTLLLDN